MPGTRGACIVWHPVQKKYYAVFAGNGEYPVAVFDAKGKRLSADTQNAMIDTRGLWYDPAKKLIFGNAYKDYGWFSYNLDAKGIPVDYKEENEGMNQPGPQSVAAYNPVDKQVLFLFGNQVFFYNNDADALDSTIIHWGQKKTDGADEDEEADASKNYNYTTLVYTGGKGQEIGVLNVVDKQVELYDIKSGFQHKVLSLPSDATTETNFNFAYTNGLYWLFDMKERKWVGYK